MRIKILSSLSKLAIVLIPATSWSQEIQNIYDSNGNVIFEARYFDTDDGYYAYANNGSPTSSIRNLTSNERNNLRAALDYWGELIHVTPGHNPTIINIGTNDDFGGSALSPLASNQSGAVTKVQAAINNQNPGELILGAHGYINIGDSGWSTANYVPSQITLSSSLNMTTVMIHEIAHALGVSSNSRMEYYDPTTGQALLDFENSLSKWDSLLFDDNGQQAKAGQLIHCQLCFNLTEHDDGTPLRPDEIFDVKNDRAYIAGKNVKEVLAGSMPGIPLTLYHPLGGLDLPALSHLELKNSLMSHQRYRNYPNFMEAEVALLQDLGYHIDRRNFWGYSIYGDNSTIVNDNPFFARNKEGTGYLPTTYNTSTLGLGLHVYGSRNNITQRADLLSAGAGGGGIRVDGEGNAITILPGTRIHANGAYGRGVMFAYGKNHFLTQRGDVRAEGEKGIAVSFDFGRNDYSDKIETRGSYIHTKNGEAAPLLDEINGPLVTQFDLTGTVSGKHASIYISDNAYVENINVMGAAHIDGDIISDYNQRDDNDDQRVTQLTFGIKADTNGQATQHDDANFALAYAGNIKGINNLALELRGGVTQLTGHHQLYDVTVTHGATLLGSGTYTLHQHGMFANHGNVSVPKVGEPMTVTGNYHQAPTAQLQLAFDDQHKTSTFVVQGHASLAGTLNLTAAPGYYNNGYAISSDQWLVADSTTGSFDRVTANISSPTLHAATQQNDTTYAVSIVRNDDAYAQYGTHSNARNVGEALVSAARHANASSSALFTALDFSALDGRDISTALPLLSGEIHASAKGALINTSAATRTAVSSRLQQAYGDTPSSRVALSNEDSLHGPAAWGYGFGTWSHQKGDGNAARLNTDTSGFFTGVDALIHNDWRFGLLAGYSRSTFKLNERASSGSSDNYTLGAYTGTAWQMPSGALALRSGAAYTWHQLDMKRAIGINAFRDSVSADYDANSLQIFAELGYKTPLSASSFIEPYAGLAYVKLKTDGFTEKGQNGTNLAVRSDTMDTTFSTLGLRTSTLFDLGPVPTVARIDLGWRHAWGDTVPRSVASFSESTPFSVSGNPIGKNTALVETGIDFHMGRHTTLGASYQGQFGSGLSENAVSVNLKARF